MKQLFLFILCLLFDKFASSQFSSKYNSKPPIDTSILGKWPMILGGKPVISNDGSYVAYIVFNMPVESKTLIVHEINGVWKKELEVKQIDGKFYFSANNKKMVWKNADTLFFLAVKTGEISKIFPISTCQIPEKAEGEWLAYKFKNAPTEVVLFNLLTDEEKYFSNVLDFKFDKLGKTMIVTEATLDSNTTVLLKWIRLTDYKSTVIWSPTLSKKKTSVSFYSFDYTGDQLTFVVKENEGDGFYSSIWYYKNGMSNATEIVNKNSKGIPENFKIAPLPAKFNQNGKWIFIRLMESSSIKKIKPGSVMVDLWSYRDVLIQPEQMRLVKEGSTFTAAVSTSGGQVIALENNDSKLQTSPEYVTGDYVVVRENNSVPYWWMHDQTKKVYLVSLKDNIKKAINKDGNDLYCFSCSPEGRYILFWDAKVASYYSYDVQQDKLMNITKTISTQVNNEFQKKQNEDQLFPVTNYPVAWYSEDSALLLYDNYDIWKIYPSNNKLPINLTNGFGYKHHIKLRLVDAGENNSLVEKKVTDAETLLITGFNVVNKHNGFLKMHLDKKGNPELLTMAPFTYYRTESQKPHYYSFGNGTMRPVKAADADAWVLMRSSATEAPNFIFTNDFKKFTPLSNLHPQSDYNWLKTELITWKQPDGNINQGILYKPENFDANKKYPVIFNYYEQLTHRVYEFAYPAFTYTNINIPWFVSNGYLVFTPDIQYKVAAKSGISVGKWAYNSVVSAAEVLSKLPYVNKEKLGIQGHSFGGMETNYLVTNTNRFAAAAEAAGITDPVSAYLTLVKFWTSVEHYSRQEVMERGHELYGTTLWKRPDLFLENSAVLNAHKTTTPILIYHNEKDHQINSRQGVEFYMALRRLGKKCWMLQYDDSDHGLAENDGKDYTIRLTQFFDHYLKDAPPPKWMTKGIGASMKGIETGYDLDPSGNCGKACKVCQKWNSIQKALK